MPVYSGGRIRASLFLLIPLTRICSDACYFSGEWFKISSRNLEAIADLQEVKVTDYEILQYCKTLIFGRHFIFGILAK